MWMSIKVLRSFSSLSVESDGVRGATIVWHGGEESVNVSVHACGNFKVHLILTSSRALLCFSAIFLLSRSNFFNSTSKKKRKNSINLLLFPNEICNSNETRLEGRIQFAFFSCLSASYRSTLHHYTRMPISYQHENETREPKQFGCNYVWSWISAGLGLIKASRAIRGMNAIFWIIFLPTWLKFHNFT